jgi:hypothetical protein
MAFVMSPVYTDVTWRWVYMSQYFQSTVNFYGPLYYIIKRPRAWLLLN